MASLQDASEGGDVARVVELLASCADANANDMLGRTALILASMQGRAGVVEMLLAHAGIDTESKDSALDLDIKNPTPKFVVWRTLERKISTRGPAAVSKSQ